jgi:hypothetical protein
LRSTRLEEFLLARATRAGVLAVSSKRTAKNPNKWVKHLAPWYDARCKDARALQGSCKVKWEAARPHSLFAKKIHAGMQGRPRETPVCVARHAKIKTQTVLGHAKAKGQRCFRIISGTFPEIQ